MATVDKQKRTTHKVGSLHWRRGYQDLTKVLNAAEEGDSILFPSRKYTLNERAQFHKDMQLEGQNETLIMIPNVMDPTNNKKEQGFLFGSDATIQMSDMLIDIEPETNGIVIDQSFTGHLLLDNIQTRHTKRILYKDDRPAYPSIKARGKGTLTIKNANIDYMVIDAPEMTLIIEESTIGTFDTSSLISVQEMTTLDTTINNAHLMAKKGTHNRLKTNGGIALSGAHGMANTQLIPLNAIRPERYPEALTYIIVQPHSKIYIDTISSSEATKPPYYRHFDIRQSQMIMEKTSGLTTQLLSNVSTNSQIKSTGMTWLEDPDTDEKNKERHKLLHAPKD